jgi:hypothetical protein
MKGRRKRVRKIQINTRLYSAVNRILIKQSVRMRERERV